MSELFFVDTNVLVYSRDASEPEKQPRAAQWRRALWQARAGRLSMQVLHEFYQVVTRKLRPGLKRRDAQAEITDLMQWDPLASTPELLRQAWAMEEAHQLSFWDALIVAAAHASNCDYLLSEDLGHERDLGGLTVIDPFQRRPA